MPRRDRVRFMVTLRETYLSTRFPVEVSARSFVEAERIAVRKLERQMAREPTAWRRYEFGASTVERL